MMQLSRVLLKQPSTTRGFASLSMDNINKNLVEMKYAVRGQVPIKAAQIDQELRTNPNHSRPFDEILYCNIGNPQSVGQPPITFYRQVLSLVDNPKLLRGDEKALRTLYSDYEIERAWNMVESIPGGSGAYSDSQGIRAVREHVAEFISKRDGYQADPSKVFLSNGASSSIQMLLTAIIANPTDAIMIPIPQYPIYTALIRLLNGKEAGYFLKEEQQWALRQEELERAYSESVSKGHNPRAMVIINPGNPTGNTLTYDDLSNVVRFCHEKQLVLLSDEVYQENCYAGEEKPFVSAKKVMHDLGLDDLQLASFHSTSKGFIGECGRRGGYMELHGIDHDVMQQIVKLASSGLCSNLDGQLMTDLMVRSPTKSEASCPTAKLFCEERDSILDGLKKKSKMVHDHLNAIPGVSCQALEGAMYAFPRIDLPKTFVEKAKNEGLEPDAAYALSLLENTGICTVPGSGFEQEPGTYHLRLTFLPPPDRLEKALVQFKEHHLALK